MTSKSNIRRRLSDIIRSDADKSDQNPAHPTEDRYDAGAGHDSVQAGSTLPGQIKPAKHYQRMVRRKMFHICVR